MSCRRPSNSSSRLALPLGPSKWYSFSTAIHGIRRRSAASASRARVNSFSFTSSCWRAASHSFGETVLGWFTWFFFLSASLVFILVVLCLYLFAAPVKTPKHERGHSSAGRSADSHESNISDACGTHVVFSLYFVFLFSDGRFSFSKYSARRSSDPCQNLRYSSTHCAACRSGLASSRIS